MTMSTSCSHACLVFTLIELLVVIGIIAILMTILLPALKNAKDYSKKSVCLSNQKQIGVALVSYAGDSNGFLPSLNHKTSYWLLSGGMNTNLGQLVPNYLSVGGAQALYCPAPNGYIGSNYVYDAPATAPRRFIIEYPTGSAIGHYHYRPGVWPVLDADLPQPGLRLGKASGSTAVVAELFNHDGSGSQGSRTFYLPHCVNSAAFQGQNVLYLDGGAKWYKMSYTQLSAIDPSYSSSKSTHQNMWEALDER